MEKDPHLIRSILFSINRWGEGTTCFSIMRKANSAAIYMSTGSYMSPQVYEIAERKISLAEFNAFADRLYRQFEFEKWDEEYHGDSLDGTNWYMIVKFSKQQFLERRGSNAYPKYWNEVVDHFMALFPDNEPAHKILKT